jgi:hypothetical protein
MPILTPFSNLTTHRLPRRAHTSGTHLPRRQVRLPRTPTRWTHSPTPRPRTHRPPTQRAHMRLTHHLGALRALHLRNHLPTDFSASHAGLVCSGVPVALQIRIVLMGVRHVAHMWICITWRLVRGVRGVRDVGVRECGVGSLLPAEEEDDATDEGEEDCGASDGRSCNATRAEL